MKSWLPRVDELPPKPRLPVQIDALLAADDIIGDVRAIGEPAIRRYSERMGDLAPGDPIVLGRDELEEARARITVEQRQVLERVAERIRLFAQAQRDGLDDLDVVVTGGRAGHRWIPVSTVGAYAPGGRHPLPSSVLMTVIPARVAGVAAVWVSSPRPTDVTLAAAAVAGADGLLTLGGAQAIAALAFGTVSPRCDLVVGPGNKYVTAAKKLLVGEVGIDGLAGPSEILVIADEHADPRLVAADLLAQAEHDTEAVPMLVTTSRSLAEQVDFALSLQMADLPTSTVARAALRNGFALVVGSLSEAAEASDQVAPEHLALHVEQPEDLLRGLASYGSVFIGGRSAEAFADYGVGPNHVLPTGGGARFQSGLSVLTFLKTPTWSRLDDPAALIDDTVLLARLEGLEAHARAAQVRGAD
ncbi:MAG TPA: histidinol dehydrogenase [Acidimicrobiia bacterium]|jgi:phosphoribosyl-ATP pyrophosphohydrolase/phosphoribosyl-AMP cyclohydrolase/histidinol dehydrogenase